MATIGGSRPNYAIYVGILVDATSTRLNRSLKRSPSKKVKFGSSDPTPTLRDSYLAASTSTNHTVQVLKDSSQLALDQDLNNSAASTSDMAPVSGYERLSSGPPSPVLGNTAIVTDIPASGLEVKSTSPQSDLVQNSTPFLKRVLEKPLPRKPVSCPNRLSEPGEAVNTPIPKAVSLLDLDPVIEHSTFLETVPSGQQSSDSSDLHAVASNLSESQSLDSISTGEYCIATAMPIQAITNRHVRIVTQRSHDSASRDYTLRAPGFSKVSRKDAPLHNGQIRHISPSRSSLSQDRANRSILHGRQALSMRGRRSLLAANTPRHNQAVGIQGNSRSDLHSGASNTGVITERDHTDDVFEESVTDQGIERTSSKYGFNIRESFDAREAIMGETGSSNLKTGVGSLVSNHSVPVATTRNVQIRELNLKLATPSSDSKPMNLGEPGTSGGASVTSHLRGAGKSVFCTPPYPPRTSSLPKTYVANTAGLSPDDQQPLVSKIKIRNSDSSNYGEKAPQTSRLSLLYRQTIASSARASSNAKKINGFKVATSRIPQSSTLSSFGDVGKGMKNLGKKVGNIIPHRRSISVEKTSNDVCTEVNENRDDPHRKPSRVLTTYRNSGMEDSLDETSHQSAHTGNSFVHPQPNDRHEADGAEKEKKIWREGSRNFAHDTATGGFVHFGQRNGGEGNGSGDEGPPPPRPTQIMSNGHYIEDTARDGLGGLVDNEFTPLTNHQHVQSTEHGELPPTRRGSAVSNDTLVAGEPNDAHANVENSNTGAHNLMADDQLERMLAETATQAHNILNYATSLAESPLRSLMIESATHLTEAIMYTREARVHLVQSTQALDEATVFLAANTHRMFTMLQELSALPI